MNRKRYYKSNSYKTLNDDINFKNHQTNTYFTIGNLFSEFSADSNGLHKKALIAYEGQHTDAKGRGHEFTSERIKKIVENTNAAFQSGSEIPIIVNHDKTDPLKIVGSVEAPFEARIIQEQDLPNPRAKELLGKVGIFCSDMLIKAKEYQDGVAKNLVKNISMGLDLLSDSIKEVSFVTLPAMKHAAVFKRSKRSKHHADFSLSWEELENSGIDEEAAKEQYDQYCDGLWDLIGDIMDADENQLQGQDPKELVDNAFSGFIERVSELLGLGEQVIQEQSMNPYLPQGGYDSSNMAGQRRLLDTTTDGANSVSSRYSINTSGYANFEDTSKKKKKKKTKYMV